MHMQNIYPCCLWQTRANVVQVETGAVSEDVWGLCLHAGNSNGTITIGGLDMSLATSAMQYTPDIGAPQFYEMKMNGIVRWLLDTGRKLCDLSDGG